MGQTKLSVVLIVACAVKCLAISYDELEDFADYIKRTSQLSPILKKGAEADEYDADENMVVSDNAWEESGKFEGDLILNDRQRRLIVENVAEGIARNGLSDGTKRWPDGEVIFHIQVEHFSNDQVQAILSGIDDLARASCIKFRRYRKGDRDAVVIQGNRAGCFSQVGYQGGYQVLNLSGRHPIGRGCFRHGTIVHEMLHTLGFYHMQSSPERDDYVDVQWANIVQRARHNFRKYNAFSVSNFGVGYDYGSVLHYSRRAFSSNGQDTLVPKQSGVEIGQRLGLSDKDVQKLNRMYCDADADLIPADENAQSKKKSSKNKPLNIYGIGYHQGKAVVIKVLPKAAAQKLPEVPTSYVFDYFSKTPQILSTPSQEGFRIGKEIAEYYKQSEPITRQEYEKLVDNMKKPEKYSIAEGKAPRHHGVEYANIEIPRKLDDNLFAQKEHYDSADPALIEPFDRLKKILKSHVYPSQNPDLTIYKMHGQHVEHEVHPKEVKIENADLILTASPIKHQMSQAEKIKSAMHFINNLYDSNTHQAYENDYHPATNSYYEDDNKNSNKKEGLLVITGTPDTKNKDRKYIDPSYTTPFLRYEGSHHTSSDRPGQDEFPKYDSKIRHREKTDTDHDDWYHKYAHTPYKYNPPKYDSGDDMDYLRPSSLVEDGYFSSSVPSKSEKFISRSPFLSDKYNIKNQEYR